MFNFYDIFVAVRSNLTLACKLKKERKKKTHTVMSFKFETNEDFKF